MNKIEEIVDQLNALRASMQRQSSRDAILAFGLAVDSLGYQSAEKLRSSGVDHSKLLLEAIGLHRRFLEGHDVDPVILNNLGVMVTNSGKASEGRKHFVEAVALLPSDRNIHENLGITDVLVGRDRSVWHKIPDDLQRGDNTLVAYFDPQAM